MTSDPRVDPGVGETAGETGPLVVRTVGIELDEATQLLDLVPDDHPVSWLRRGDGLVGWGRAAEIVTTGPTRFGDADKWWTETVARAVVRDEVGEPGSGLVCFGAFAFADQPGDSILTVPSVVVGRRGDVAWLTTITRGALTPQIPLALADPPRPPVGVSSSRRRPCRPRAPARTAT